MNAKYCFCAAAVAIEPPPASLGTREQPTDHARSSQESWEHAASELSLKSSAAVAAADAAHGGGGSLASPRRDPYCSRRGHYSNPSCCCSRCSSLRWIVKVEEIFVVNIHLVCLCWRTCSFDAVCERITGNCFACILTSFSEHSAAAS